MVHMIASTRVLCTKAEKGWTVALSIPDGVDTFTARSLGGMESSVARIIQDHYGTDLVLVDIRLDLDEKDREAVETAAAMRRQADDLNEKMYRAAATLRTKGYSMRDIAATLSTNLSRIVSLFDVPEETWDDTCLGYPDPEDGSEVPTPDYSLGQRAYLRLRGPEASGYIRVHVEDIVWPEVERILEDHAIERMESEHG